VVDTSVAGLGSGGVCVSACLCTNETTPHALTLPGQTTAPALYLRCVSACVLAMHKRRCLPRSSCAPCSPRCPAHAQTVADPDVPPLCDMVFSASPALAACCSAPMAPASSLPQGPGRQRGARQGRCASSATRPFPTLRLTTRSGDLATSVAAGYRAFAGAICAPHGVGGRVGAGFQAQADRGGDM
jgi:hypothetical protein